MTVGDRVKFRTNGGWYNAGVIEDIDEKNCLVKVDTLGYKAERNDPIALPYYVRVSLDLLIPEYECQANTLEQYLAPSPDLSFYKRKKEDKNMTNYEWLVRNKAELVKDILCRHLSKEKGIPNYCSVTYCRDCDFRCGDCNERTKEWLEAEHDPLYKKGDIVVDSHNKIIVVTKDYYYGEFVTVSRYIDDLECNQYKILMTDIKKKVGHIEESEV